MTGFINATYERHRGRDDRGASVTLGIDIDEDGRNALDVALHAWESGAWWIELHCVGVGSWWWQDL
jgi:hypothetical protein